MQILIAEELPTVPTLLEALEQYQTAVATTVRDARALIADHVFDLAIVGIHFDESRAIELISWMRIQAPTIPILLVQLRASDLDQTYHKTGLSLQKSGAIRQYLNLEFMTDWQTTLVTAINALKID